MSHSLSLADAITDYLQSGGALSLPEGGGPIELLEQEFARLSKRSYGIAVNSGTSGLAAVFGALKLKTADRVAVPLYSFHASITPALRYGAIPAFCDVDPSTGNVCMESLKKVVSTGVKAIVVTHMYGYPVDMRSVCEIAKAAGVPVVEDCSHAHWATVLMIIQNLH